MKVNLGQTQMTSHVARFNESSKTFAIFTQQALTRHINGDWGQCHEADAALNDLTAASGQGRIISNYPFPEKLKNDENLPDTRLWIITYPGKQTTVLFPWEY